MDLDQPEPPNLVLAPEPLQGRIKIEVSEGAAVPAPEWYVLEYQDSGGSWLPVRGYETLVGSGPFTLYDYEAPFIRPRTYRARSVVIIGPNILSSPATIQSSQLVMPKGSAWITDVHDPTLFNSEVIATADRERVWQGLDHEHHPANSPYTVVESEIPRVSDRASFLATNSNEHDFLELLFASTRILLYRDDRREHFYFKWVGNRSRTQIGPRRIDADQFQAQMVVVERPPA